MRNIKKPTCFSHCKVLLPDAGILQRHLPTAERYHARVVIQVGLIKTRMFHGILDF